MCFRCNLALLIVFIAFVLCVLDVLDVYLDVYSETTEHMTEHPTTFYKGYKETLQRVNRMCKEILLNNKSNSDKKYIVFDLDNTLIFVRPFIPVSGIMEIIDLYFIAKTFGYVCVLITARDSKTYKNTIETCKEYGLSFRYIYMKPVLFPCDKFKSRVRTLLEYIPPGDLPKTTDKLLKFSNISRQRCMSVLLSIGDQWEDVERNHVYGVKLPDPFDMNAYMIIHRKAYVI